MDLIVTGVFGDYAIGDRITDAGMVKEYMDSPNVVRVASEEPATDQAVK